MACWPLLDSSTSTDSSQAASNEAENSDTKILADMITFASLYDEANTGSLDVDSLVGILQLVDEDMTKDQWQSFALGPEG